MTLLEIVIALLFLTIGILAVASMQVIGMQTSVGAGLRAGDCMVAADYIEEILSWPYEDPRLSDPDDGFQPRRPDHGPVEIRSRGVAIEWEVDGRLPVANVKRIFITVRRNKVNGEVVHSFNYIKARWSVLTGSGGESIDGK